jgi:hypothetical protein
MGLTRNEFEKMLDQLLAGELADEQLAALEDSAARDPKASRELDRVKNLQAALWRNSRDYRRMTYPGNLALEVLDRTRSQPLSALRYRSLSFALVAISVVVFALVLILQINPPPDRISVVYPSFTVMANINKELSEFKITHNRQLAGWSRQALLAAPLPGAIRFTGLKMPSRPMIENTKGSTPNNSKGAKI